MQRFLLAALIAIPMPLAWAVESSSDVLALKNRTEEDGAGCRQAGGLQSQLPRSQRLSSMADTDQELRSLDDEWQQQLIRQRSQGIPIQR